MLAACATTPSPSTPLSTATTMQAAGLVDIRSLVPDIALEMRYAGSDNFTGAPVPGYGAPRCFLLRLRPPACALRQ